MVATTDFFVPRSVDEALGVLAEHSRDLLILGGGTIIMGQVNDGTLLPRRMMSLARAGLDEVMAFGDVVTIGACATLARVATLPDLPLLAQAARLVGGPAVRSMATIGGNLFARSPHGDLGVPLLALDAQVELAGPAGRRVLPLAAFYGERDGPPESRAEMLTAVRVRRPGGRTAYLKQARRQANAPAVVAVAVQLTVADGGACTTARIALGAVGAYPRRAMQAEEALVGAPLTAERIAVAAQAAMDGVDPPTDAQASGWYRRKMTGVWVRRALERAMREA